MYEVAVIPLGLLLTCRCVYEQCTVTYVYVAIGDQRNLEDLLDLLLKGCFSRVDCTSSSVKYWRVLSKCHVVEYTTIGVCTLQLNLPNYRWNLQ